MPRMPALVDTLARLDGRSTVTLHNFALHLRSSGFITQAGRGMASAFVDREDAATMLVASMVTESPTAAPRCVEIFQGLQRLHQSPDKSLPRTLGLLIQLPTFGEFLTEALGFPGMIRQEIGDGGLLLHLSRSVPAAALELREPMGGRRIIAEWVCSGKADAVSLPEGLEGLDRRLTATITHRTLLAIGDLLERAEAWS